MSSYDDAARKAETQQQLQKGPEAFLSYDEREQLKRLLSFPEEFPPKFGAWIREYMSINGALIPQSQIQGLSRYIYLRGETLPGNPSDGQFFLLTADETTGTKWAFRYNEQSTSDYKWEFSGGPPLYATIATSESTNSSSYTNLATTGPTVTVPIAGEYFVSVGCRVRVASSAIKGYMSFTGPSAVAASDSRACGADVDSLGGLLGMNFFNSVMTEFDAAGDVTSKYRVPDSTSRAFSDRNISVVPIRIG